MRLTLENVSYTYQPDSPFATTALHDISLTVEQGEFWALIGHTGSGKSTLLQHMNGLTVPTSGRVLWDGADIHEKGFDRRKLRKSVGLVFQYPEHQLFDETVEKDIGFGPRNMGLTASEVRERVQWAMDQVGLDYEALRELSPFALSGGQMRRVALAGVLAMQPAILILDEPTSGLDPMGRQDLMRCICHLHENGTGIVMVTHSMDDAAAYAQRIAVMDHGRMVLQGTPEEVFAKKEALRANGLNIPQTAQLYELLLEKGVALPGIPFSRAEAADMLCALIQSQKAPGGDGHAQ